MEFCRPIFEICNPYAESGNRRSLSMVADLDVAFAARVIPRGVRRTFVWRIEFTAGQDDPYDSSPGSSRGSPAWPIRFRLLSKSFGSAYELRPRLVFVDSTAITADVRQLIQRCQYDQTSRVTYLDLNFTLHLIIEPILLRGKTRSEVSRDERFCFATHP